LRKGDNQGALDAFHAALADEALARGTSRALVLEHAAEAHARLGDAMAAARCRTLAEAERFPRGPADAVPHATVPSVGERGSVC